MKPSLGRIVHVVLDGEAEYAAIVTQYPGMVTAAYDDGVEYQTPDTRTDSDVIGVSVFLPGGDVYGVPGLPYSETKEPFSWHWPERES
jgi:hypothetical protein